MPDYDRFPRGIRRPWRTAAALVAAGRDSTVVAASAGEAVVRELRESGGAPLLPKIAKRLHACLAGVDVGAGLTVRVGNPAERYCALAARGLAANEKETLLGVPVGVLEGLLSDAVVRHLIRAELLDPVLSDRVGASEVDYAEAADYADRCLGNDAIKRIARDLAKDPSAASLRTPRRRKQTTADLMHRPLGKLSV